jgi:hypothetical protein
MLHGTGRLDILAEIARIEREWEQLADDWPPLLAALWFVRLQVRRCARSTPPDWSGAEAWLTAERLILVAMEGDS